MTGIKSFSRLGGSGLWQASGPGWHQLPLEGEGVGEGRAPQGSCRKCSHRTDWEMISEAPGGGSPAWGKRARFQTGPPAIPQGRLPGGGG